MKYYDLKPLAIAINYYVSREAGALQEKILYRPVKFSETFYITRLYTVKTQWDNFLQKWI